MDVQKTMEFILEQQAAYAADRQRQAADIEKLTASTEALKALVLAHDSDIQAHDSDIQTHTEWLSGLSAALQRLTDQMQDGFAKMSAAIAAANADNKETRENLNILVRTVQDMIPHLPKQ
jgi:septal ring factor EnvC (AmiA/AmiB activator)